MKKSSVGRPSKAPVRLSSRGSTRGNGPPDIGTSSRSSSESRLKSHIPLPKTRGSSCERDRDSRSRSRAIDLSGIKKQSVSHATPSTPLMQHLDVPLGFTSAQSSRSRSSSKCSSTEKGFLARKGKLSDTRPIKDPGWQHRAMVRVYNYFQRQPQAIRDLCPLPNTRSVMIQSFVDMMGHLLHHFIKNHGVYKKNYTDEIPKLMKKLHYPGIISSSWLKTVNAPHAWPHVVAALSWLVDLVVQRENINMDDFFRKDMDRKDIPMDPKILFEMLLSGFEAWNNGDDALAEKIDQEFHDSLMAGQGFTDQDMDRVAKANAAMKEELDDPEERQAAAKHESLVDSVRALAAKEKAAAHTNRELENSIDGFKGKLVEYHDQYDKLQHNLQSKTKKRDELAQSVAAQPMSTEDAKAIKEEITNIEREIKNNNAYLDEQQKITGADDIKMAFIKKKLNDMCVNFNKEILQSNFTELHKLTVQTNLNFFERDLDKARSEMHKIDVGLEELKSQLNEKIHKEDCSLEKQDEILKELKTERKRVGDRIKALEEEQLVKGKELQTLEADIEKKQIDFKAEYDATTAKITQLVKSKPDIDGITAELHKAREKESECQQNFQEMVKNTAEFLRDEARALVNYKTEVLKDMSEALHS